jgi:hypothetical protein
MGTVKSLRLYLAFNVAGIHTIRNNTQQIMKCTHSVTILACLVLFCLIMSEVSH